MTIAVEEPTPTQVRRALNSTKEPKRDPNQTDVEQVTGPGHNGPELDKHKNFAADRLRSIVERIERLEEERKALSSDIKDLFTEAKSAGFSTSVLRKLIRLRSKDPSEVEEEETLLDVYRHALGMA